MILGLCILLTLAAAVTWLILRQPRTGADDSSGTSEGQEYHAVSITTDEHPCAAVQTIFGQRFLPDSAPQFPLPECDRSATCACRYEHYDDRRAGRDRRDVWAKKVRLEGFPDDERAQRSKKDRRSAELATKT